MPTIAITGGIASGKTAFRQYLSSRWNAEPFDADAAVAEFMDHSEEVRQEIEETFAPTVYREGRLDKEQMRTRIFSHPEARKKLEGILHPRIQAIWRKRAADCAETKSRFLVEIPLLYETGGETFCDFVIVVACSLATQLERLTSSRGLEKPFANKIIKSQISTEDKIRRADLVIWNDGPEELLIEQADLTANYFVERYG